MAFVIVSAGHLTQSQLRMVRAQPLVIGGACAALLLIAASVFVGFFLARYAGPVTSSSASARLSRAEMHALVNRVGELAGQLAQLKQETAALGRMLGTVPATAALVPDSRTGSTGGPMIPVDGIAQLEADVEHLGSTIDFLTDAAIERGLESMAYPNRMPVAGLRVPVSSRFGTRRDPFTGRLARHSGLDIPARYGTPILASGGGRVVFAGRKGAYGLAVVIDHGEGLATLYGHASKLVVRAGDVVLPQQKVALVGSTGRSTGAHLHFEVIRNGARVEPREYLVRVLDPHAATVAKQ